MDPKGGGKKKSQNIDNSIESVMVMSILPQI